MNEITPVEFVIMAALSITGGGLAALAIRASQRTGPFICRLGLHAWLWSGNAYTQAPAPIRCRRCGQEYRA